MLTIAIDQIFESPGNARKIAATAAADKALLTSLETIGMLQPVLVVPDFTTPDGRINGVGRYELRAGHRRLAAARALGWTEIPALVLEAAPYGGAGADVPETAMSAAENMVRVSMHPVDQWRAICDLRDNCAYSLDTAAAALGVDLALARRLEWLGRMDPAILDLIGQGDLPEARHLRQIAMAPHEVQRKAVEKAKGAARYQAGNEYFWMQIADACTLKRIPQDRAIFDCSLLAWDEDLFAQPDDGDRFTTMDVEAFLTHQRKALATIVGKSKGRMELLKENDTDLPGGWQRAWGEIPKRWKKDDPRRVFAALRTTGYDVGEVDYLLASPSAAKTKVKAPSLTGTPAARPIITKAVQGRLADLKGDAITDRLKVFADNGPADMLRTLLMVFTTHTARAGTYPTGPYSDLARLLVNPDGTPAAVSDQALCQAAAYLVSQAITFDAPDRFSASGPGADWIARAIGAEVPRCDTDEILKGVAGDTLRELAAAAGIKSTGTVSAVRQRLVGNLPDWRPVDFAAIGPAPGEDEDDLETDTGFSTTLIDAEENEDLAENVPEDDPRDAA